MPKQTYEEWKATLSPEQEAARKASDQFADQESMGDIQSKLPETARFSGSSGLLPWIGYTRNPSGVETLDPEFRARIKNSVGGKSGASAYLKNKGGVMGLTAGQYYKEGSSDKANTDIVDKILADAGSDPLSQGEIWMNSLPSELLLANGAYHAPPEVLNHELTHRATDSTSAMMSDFLEFVGVSSELSSQEKEDISESVSGGKREALADEMQALSLTTSPEVSLSKRGLPSEQRYLPAVDKAMKLFLPPKSKKNTVSESLLPRQSPS
jgi:hypothetical protein